MATVDDVWIVSKYQVATDLLIRLRIVAIRIQVLGGHQKGHGIHKVEKDIVN